MLEQWDGVAATSSGTLIPASAEPCVHGQMTFGLIFQQPLLFSVGHVGAELVEICSSYLDLIYGKYLLDPWDVGSVV